jgi:HAD superfamily hydrolase (TIGR01509 family)
MHAASDIFGLNASMVPIVAHLHAARYRLGVLSNTNEAHWSFVSQGRYAVIQCFFEVHALSFQMRVMKPDPRIYLEAAKLAGMDPESIFFTDDRAENVAAARGAGFDAVLFENARQLSAELRARGIRWNF